MAITGIEYTLFRSLREQNVLPLGGDILELGEANWYGDVNIGRFGQDIYRYAPEAARKQMFLRLDEIARTQAPDALWELARLFWQTFLQPRSMTAIDFDGTERALRLDLNDPIDLQRSFDAVLNLGTVEHVFNVAQAFKTIHNHTAPGGLMMHGLPFAGWVDHGFYNFNPTFYWDLAAANRYTIVAAVYTELNPLRLVPLTSRERILEMARDGQIGKNALIYVALRRPAEAEPFCVPIQGYYARSISRTASDAWAKLR